MSKGKRNRANRRNQPPGASGTGGGRMGGTGSTGGGGDLPPEDRINVPPEFFNPDLAPYCTVCGQGVQSWELREPGATIGTGPRIWQHDSQPIPDVPELGFDPGHEPVVAWRTKNRRCDFCNSADGVAWTYEVVPGTNAMDAVMADPTGDRLDLDLTATLNDTPWDACHGCADLIEAKDWGELLRRAVASSVFDRATAEMVIVPFQRIFRAAYTGRRYPADRGPGGAGGESRSPR